LVHSKAVNTPYVAESANDFQVGPLSPKLQNASKGRQCYEAPLVLSENIAGEAVKAASDAKTPRTNGEESRRSCCKALAGR
jgi:hypothetical protein